MQEQYRKQKDGTLIAVGDMDIEHLRNVLRMLIKRNYGQDNYIDDLALVGGYDGGEFYKR